MAVSTSRAVSVPTWRNKIIFEAIENIFEAMENIFEAMENIFEAMENIFYLLPS